VFYKVQDQLKFRLLSIITAIKHEKLNNQTNTRGQTFSSKGSLINTKLRQYSVITLRNLQDYLLADVK